MMKYVTRPESDTGTLICGAGATCEQTCPFIRLGSACPDVDTIAAECAADGLSLWDVLRGALLAS